MSYQPRYRETVTGFGAGSAESKDVSSVLQSIETDLKRYQQLVTIIGTSQDDGNIREESIEIRSTIKDKLTTAKTDIIQQQQTATPRDKVALDKLSKQLQKQLERYKQIMDDHNKRRNTYSLQTPDYNTGGSQRYHSSQQTISLQKQEENVEQRESEAAEIQALERDIVGLNEAFKDLAVMVNDQGEQIDRIETDVENATNQVQQGNKQLSRTVELVKSNRKLQLCILITCIIIAIVIILIIVIPIAVTQ